MALCSEKKQWCVCTWVLQSNRWVGLDGTSRGQTPYLNSFPPLSLPLVLGPHMTAESSQPSQ